MASKAFTWTYGPLLYLLVQYLLLRQPSRLSVVCQACPFFIVSAIHLVDAQQPILILWFFHIFGYLVYISYLLFSNKQTLLRAWLHPNTTYYWLLYLVAGLLVVILLEIVVVNLMIHSKLPTPLLMGLVGSLIGVYICSIALFALYQPEIFQFTPAEGETGIAKPKNYGRQTELTSKVAAKLSEELQRLTHDTKLYLDDSLSLPKLAALMGISTNQLSELLNVHNQISFYDYLNQLRFDEALRLIHKADSKLTIADIAYQAGFNNRNTFYQVFKKRTGTTPTQFWGVTAVP